MEMEPSCSAPSPTPSACDALGRSRPPWYGETDARAEPRDSLDLVPTMEIERVDVVPLTRCLARLEERSRLVVALSFQEGRSAEEVAARLGTTAGNVRVIRHRALAQLHDCMEGGHRA